MIEPWSIQPQTGGNVAPANVVGRDAVIVASLEMLRAGNSLLIVDPRRMGKSSMLARLANEPGEGFDAITLSYEGVATSEEFFNRTVKAVRDHAGLWDRVRKTLEPIVEVKADKGPITVKAAFADRPRTDLLIDVLERVEDKVADDQRLIIVMDEVPLAARNIVRSEGAEVADVLLQRLRAVRQSSERLCWIVAGSIGFHHVLRSASTTEGVIGDMTPVLLGPLATDGAELLARCLLLGIGRSAADPIVDQMVIDTGGIPFLLHHLMHQLSSSGAGPVTADEATMVWDGFVTNRDHSKAMTHLVTRLDEYPADVQPAARAILDHTALAAATVATSDAFGLDAVAQLKRDRALELLDYLVDDHYLVDANGTVGWRYDVLRRIWIARRRLS